MSRGEAQRSRLSRSPIAFPALPAGLDVATQATAERITQDMQQEFRYEFRYAGCAHLGMALTRTIDGAQLEALMAPSARRSGVASHPHGVATHIVTRLPDDRYVDGGGFYTNSGRLLGALKRYYGPEIGDNVILAPIKTEELRQLIEDNRIGYGAPAELNDWIIDAAGLIALRKLRGLAALAV